MNKYQFYLSSFIYVFDKIIFLQRYPIKVIDSHTNGQTDLNHDIIFRCEKVDPIHPGWVKPILYLILLTPLGVLAPGSAHSRPSAQPPSTWAEIFACVCRVTFLKFPHFPVKIGLFWGVGGVPEFFSSSLESSYFCAHAKFQNCSTNPCGLNGPFWLLSAQNRVNWGEGGGSPKFFSSLEPNIFVS